MGKVLKWGGIGLAVALGLCQLYRPERTNPPVDPAKRVEAHLQFTPEIREIVAKGCRDCHTHETRWPWYSHVAPTSWLVVGDVDHAREHLNFSEWAEYDAVQADKMLAEICEEVGEGGMPLPIYVPLHPDANLTAQERKAVCEWTRAEQQRLRGAAAAQP
ncbi:MAG: heme-binding domain-containing protein [Acidobacteria bacterium]|nr:heme-binding domain-containing protein [Acidobacteriota bacterium]